MADKKISALTAASTPLVGTEVLPIVQSGATVKVSVDDLTTGKTVYGNTFSAATGAPALSISNQGTSAARIQGTNTGGTFYFGLDSSGGGLFSGYSPTLYFSGNYPILMGNNGTKQFGIETNSDIKAYAGNFVVGTSGKGVNFTANTPAAGMTSQLLNWYEEGTWTPTVSAISGAYTTVSAAQGSYTRIGRQVTLRFNFTVSNKGTGANGFVISGLPFTANGGSYSGSGFNASNATGTVLYGVSMSTQFEGYRYDGTDPVVANQSQVGVITYFV